MKAMKDILWNTFVHMSAAMGFLAVLLTILTMFDMIPIDYLKSLKAAGIFIFLLLAYAYGITYGVCKYILEFQQLPEKSEIVSYVKQLEKEHQNAEAIAIGITLSRYFWVTGRWQDRIQVGLTVWKCADENSDGKLMAGVDMVGWTSEAIGQSDQAREFLESSIKVAEAKSNFYFLSKAHRHLGGIYYRSNQCDKAEKELSLAQEATEKINDDIKRKEMKAGILYGRTEIALKKKGYDIARQYNEQAQAIYDEIEDEGRKIKCITQYAKILFQSGVNRIEIESQINKAKQLAEHYSRNESIAEADEILGDYHAYKKDFAKARNCYRESIRRRRKIGFVDTSKEMQILRVKLSKAKNKILFIEDGEIE